MAQRLRGFQRGAALLLHQAEPSTSGAHGLYSSTSSLLHHLQFDQQKHQQQHLGGAAWQRHGQWGGSLGAVRSFFSFGSKNAASPPADAAWKADIPAAAAPTEASAAPPEEALAGVASPPEFFPLPEGSAAEVVAAIHQACDALERASILAAKADTWFAPSWCISGLQAAHEMLGTPWWMSIMVFNISLRLLTFPLMVLAQKSSAKMMEFNHDLILAKKLQQAAMNATSMTEYERLVAAFRAEYNEQVSKHGDPVKNGLMVPGIMIFNGFVFLSIFNAISKLMEAKAPSLTTGGTLWFTDLTSSDPYFGLPIMCTLVTLAMVEYGLTLSGDANPVPVDRAQATKSLKWVFRGLACMFIPAGGYVAAGTALLWVSNTAFGVCQGLLLRNDKMRARVGLPSMKALRDLNARVLAASGAGAPTPGAADATSSTTPLSSRPPPAGASAATASSILSKPPWTAAAAARRGGAQ